MFQVVTLPQWECRAPEPFRRRGEAYWTCAELPLADGWSFVLKVDADPSKQVAPRTIFVVSIEKLLHCLAEIGAGAIRSVHQVAIGTPGDDDALVTNRITRIEVGEDPEDGWRKVYACHTAYSTPIVNLEDHESIGRLENRVVVARFPEPSGATCEIGIPTIPCSAISS